MKNKLTLTLAIFAAVVAGAVAIFMILDLTAFDKLYNLDIKSGNGYQGYSRYEWNKNESIATLIFSLIGLAIAISGAIFYKRIDEADYKVWFFAAIIISLSFSFGLLVLQLSSIFEQFKGISEYKKISAASILNSNNGYNSGYSVSSSLNQTLSVSEQAELDAKPWLLLIGYMFAIKATVSAVVCLGLIGSVILALREAGQSQFSTPVEKTPYKEVTKPISSRKLQASIDTLTKAKSLLDSGVISKTDFNKIKERELKL